MVTERRLRILARLVDDGTGEVDGSRLCEVGAAVTGMSGAGIMLMTDDVPRGSLCSSDAVSARLEALQYELGEGPCVDAHTHSRVVLEPDLADPYAARWLAFTAQALDAGARAVFGFPMRVGAARLGALNVYSDRAGDLTDDQHADALVMADVAAQVLLSLQAGAPLGVLAAELEAGVDLHDVVHQASGMISVQLDVSVAQALVRLRAHAFGSGRPLDDVARDIVTRVMRFPKDDDDQARAGSGGSPASG